MITEIIPFLPLSLVLIFALAVMLLEVTITKNKEILAYVSIVGIIFSAISTVFIWNTNQIPFKFKYFNNMLVIDNFSLFFYLLFLFCGGISIFSSVGYLKRENIDHGEFYSLILYSITGMMLMVSGADLIIIFLGLEIMSISIYVLVGFRRTDVKSNEAILKYFFLGSFSAGFILYGIALTYGVCGTTELDGIKEALKNIPVTYEPLLMTGILFLLVGTLFKVAAVPFHSWAPDVYEGAPLPVTGFMISAVKAASFTLFIKLMLVSFVYYNDLLHNTILAISIITMFVGNIFALTQENIKRMLAYSSISHTGYLLIGIAGLSDYDTNVTANAILYYLVAYSVSSLGIFACISYLSQKNEEFVNINDLSGIGYKFPLIGITMTIFMLSLIGVPPTGGFFAKYYLFSSAIGQGMYFTVMIAILNSMLSIYYYLRVIYVMYVNEPVITIKSDLGKVSTNMILVYTAIGTLWLGVGTYTIFNLIPGVFSLIEWSKVSIESLL